MRGLVLVVAAILLGGCATSAKFSAKMDSWVGQSEGNLVSGLGPPQSVYTLDKDVKILTYARQGQMVLPGQVYTTPVVTNTTGYYNNNPYNAQSTTYVQQQGAPMVIGMSCTINFTIHSGWVYAWSAHGNNCVSR